MKWIPKTKFKCVVLIAMGSTYGVVGDIMKYFTIYVLYSQEKKGITCSNNDTA